MPLSDLQHPDCRACSERERINVSLVAENTQLKRTLRGEVDDMPSVILPHHVDPAELRALSTALLDLANQLQE